MCIRKQKHFQNPVATFFPFSETFVQALQTPVPHTHTRQGCNLQPVACHGFMHQVAGKATISFPSQQMLKKPLGNNGLLIEV